MLSSGVEQSHKNIIRGHLPLKTFEKSVPAQF